MKIIKYVISLFTICLVSIGVLNSTEPSKEVTFPFSGANMQWVDSVFNTMTLDEKIGQLFMVAAYSDPNQNNSKAVKQLIENYHIGSVLFFKGSPTLQAQMTNEFQELSKVPLAIAIDGEWGVAMRLDSVLSFPRQLQLGAIDEKNNSLIEEMGQEIGYQCERLGIHINFAPVVDINTNPQNPVINTRSFGEDKYAVAQKSLLYMRGLQSHNILVSAKHFPGHGNTSADSHYSLPVVTASQTDIDDFELYPYKQLIKNNLTGVMIAHLYVPSLDKTKNLPSTLSKKIVTNKLRHELGFQGLIFTDALNMKAVCNAFPVGEVEFRALQAGNDILEFSMHIPEAIAAIKKAISDGRITEAEVDEHCRRVLIAKSWMKVPERTHVDLNNLCKDLNPASARSLNRKLVRASIAVVKDNKLQLPFRQLDTKKIAVVSMKSSPSVFVKKLQKQASMTVFSIPAIAGYESALTSTIEKLKSYDVVILDVQGSSSYPSKKYGITSYMVDIVSKIAAKCNVVMVLHANPYALDYFKDVMQQIETVVVAHDFKQIVQETTPEILFGAIPASGHLPVSAGGFSVGTGISLGAIERMYYGEPIEVGMDAGKLQKIDSVVNRFINYGAMPGCEILVAKDGMVVYEKAFGTLSYNLTDSVQEITIYDLASITKSAATTVSLMKLYDEHRFSLTKTLGDYLPYLRGTNKDTLLISNVLTHQSQLKAGVSEVPTFIENYYEKGAKNSQRSADFPYMLDKNLYMTKNMKYVDGAFSTTQDSNHTIEIGENLYMKTSYRDTVFRLIADSPLLPNKEVVYSDLGFYLFTDVIKNITNLSIDEYAYKNFYAKLGASTLGYCPLKRFEKQQIAPTENDEFFRRQLLQGYVHDRGASILGGVSGHAGLFSDAYDLAKLLQMLLNHGTYGGERFIQPETVDLFTSCPYCASGNRKGYGFDKPEPDRKKIDPTCHCTSPNSYGHTGFTGTLFWVDPDESLIYIFLSNRVNRKSPDASNTMLGDSAVRSRIQRIVYESII